MRSSRADAIVCVMTFVAAMALPLEFAIFLGVFLNLALYLRTASRLHLSEMVDRRARRAFPRAADPRQADGRALGWSSCQA